VYNFASQVFQQLVELRESVRILYDLAHGNTRRDHQFIEMKEIMETWRYAVSHFRYILDFVHSICFTSAHYLLSCRIRQPNVWESLLHWQDVLLWRNQIHNIVINAFSNPE
jgi:transformation/transcription domain-associated protein